MAGEDGGDGEGAGDALQRGGEGLRRFQPGGEQRVQQPYKGLGVRLRLEQRTLGFEFGSQLGMVLDDAVMHHGDAGGRVGMRVAFGRRAMGRPAGVADAGGAGQRIPLQHGSQVVELAFRPAAVDAGLDQGGDACAVIAAIFQAPQRIEQQRRGLAPADHPDDPAHSPQLSHQGGCPLATVYPLRGRDGIRNRAKPGSRDVAALCPAAPDPH